MRLNDSISRKEFEAIVKKIIGEGVDPNEIDLLFKILDSNKNDCISISELPLLPALHSKPKVKKIEDSFEVLEVNKGQRVIP